MNDRPITPEDGGGAPDPVVSAALRSMVPPEHGPAFWGRLDSHIADGPATVPTAALPLERPPPPPPLAEVVPLAAAPRRRPHRWLIPAAAVLVVVLVTAALVRTTSTDVKTTSTAANVPVETSVAPTTGWPAST